MESSVLNTNADIEFLTTKLASGSITKEELPFTINRVYNELPANTTNQKTLCNISGRGLLYCVSSLSMDNTGEFNIDVTIDGVATRLVGRCSTSDYLSYDTGIISKSIVNYFGNGSNDWRVKSINLPFVQGDVVTSREKSITLADQKNFGGTKERGEIFLLEKPLEFKSGLTVKAKRSISDSGTLPIVVVYSLL